jgi:hypothetical protein
MGMIDEQFKDHEFNRLKEENKQLKEEISEWKRMYETLLKEATLTEKILELNMNDFWDVVDQRDWYYERHENLRERMNK